MDQANNKAKGIFHILLAAFGFAAMSLFVRLSGDLPTAEKAFFRNLIAAIVALYMLRKSGQKLRIKEGCLPTLLLRSIAGTIGIYANFWAISHMAIADANILNKLAPFAAIVMSIFIIGERRLSSISSYNCATLNLFPQIIESSGFCQSNLFKCSDQGRNDNPGNDHIPELLPSL